jgi:hypothetical protein
MVAALLLALGGVAVAPVTAAGIDVGQWLFNPTTKNHYMQTEPMAWADAEAYAVSLGGHLVTINDQAEQDWLEATFDQPELWIGFSDLALEGTWVWSSGEPVTYTNWSSGEPNDNEGSEDAAVMNWLHAEWPGPDPQPLGWNDLPPSGLLGAVIEVPAGTILKTNGATTHYTFWWPGATTYTCTGTRVVNKARVMDNQTCLATGYTDGFIAGTYKGDPTGSVPGWGDDVHWYSDFDGSVATSWTVTFVDNADGTFTVTIHASY